MKKTDVYIAKTDDAYEGTKTALGALGFGISGKRVYIKPNLTGGRIACDGLTVDIGTVRAVLECLHDCPQITIGESCSDTHKAFDELGYRGLVEEFPNVQLEDIRYSEMLWKSIPKPYHTKEMPFNASVFNHDYVINIAKMKTHSLAGVTLCLKNVFGFIPTRKQKLMYHPFIGKAILDMNQVIPSNFCIVDGVWGNEFDEVQSTPKYTGAVIAGESILAVDVVAASIMGIDLNENDTYRMAFELWGKPEIKVSGTPIEELKVKYRQGCLLTTRIRYFKETAASLVYRAVNRH
ncbi:MAG: hypothetical protein A2161_12115 [Candidatus Schekmanbacteria bacterium RBG_13_48_7]|uniref:DUF362 domain-containing protein n=1 Tax=Candidatus Schekmanbacteria bacterium RBG_13_48_7 TaxID=1817878 RepID=A0A1F7RU09_9BACT|nr:MAG: hypothetical protein A2161_12115 [Candidatus Schekmanbacteria bacterium RBG_13_48_7]